ncbi:serine/threonine protein kinase, partial [Streptomyces sp. NPDC096068]
MEAGPGLPERIGGYAVERELGAGGMGTVYLARSRGGRPVAVKVARPELAADP